MSKPKLISMEEAALTGITRVRKSVWADPMDHLQIDVVNGKLSPWVKLYCPINVGVNGADPMTMSSTEDDRRSKIYEPYTGPLPDSPEYKKSAAAATSMFEKTFDEFLDNVEDPL